MCEFACSIYDVRKISEVSILELALVLFQFLFLCTSIL